MAKYITYTYRGGPEEIRFRQLADAPIPEWAIDIRDEEGNPMNEVRTTYRELTSMEKVLMAHLKKVGQELIDAINDLEPCEDREIARQKAIEAVMWGTRVITK